MIAMPWCDDDRFTISHIRWERIFFEFDITAHFSGSMPQEPRFALVPLSSCGKPATESRPAAGSRTAPAGGTVAGARTAAGSRAAAAGAGSSRSFKSDTVVFLSWEQQEAVPDGCCYHFSLNMAAAHGRSFLDNGQWRFCALLGESVYPVSIECALAYEADQWSRIFKYGKDQYAYNVSFSVQEIDVPKSSDGRIELILSSYFMRINRNWKKRRYVQEAVTLKGKFRRMYFSLVILLIRCFYFLCARLLPKNGSRVLFMTETKDILWGNLKYIHDRMLERGLDSRFKLTCSCRKSVGSRKSVLSWIKTVLLIAASDYIFIDDYAPVFGFFKLYPKSKLIQVWHAGEGFKSVGYSRFGRDGSPFPSGSCHKAYTLALTGAPNLVKVYEEVFGIEKEAILPLGMARLDHFLDPEHIRSFREQFFEKWPQFKGKQIILFAPTFRGTGQKEAWYDYSRLDMRQIYDYCGSDTCFLIKMHPFVKEPVPIPEHFSDRIYDLSAYPDINELFYITDVLITDYSSNYYEFSLLKKPIVFYTYDREFYELTRGVHRSVLKYAPGKVCDTFEALMEALKTKDYEIEKTLQFVRENFGTYDGRASDRIIDSIILNEGETNE